MCRTTKQLDLIKQAGAAVNYPSSIVLHKRRSGLFFGDSMKHIQLTQGKVALVDDVDYEELLKYKWQAYHGQYTWYATSAVYGERAIRMHRLIMDAPKDRQVDHINSNGLDNRRRNLRICTASQNQHNRKKRVKATSKYKGVTRTSARKWRAQISVLGRSVKIGSFDSEIEAARAYDLAAIELHCDFARLNFKI